MTDIELIREAADILGREGLWTYGKVSALYDRADRMEAKQELIYTCSCDAYLAKIAELEAQLSAIRQAVDVANPSDSRHYHDCVLLFKADWKAILSAVKDAPAQQPENRKCVFCNWSGTLEYLTVTPEGEFLCPKCHDRTVQQPEQGSEK